MLSTATGTVWHARKHPKARTEAAATAAAAAGAAAAAAAETCLIRRQEAAGCTRH